MALITFNRRVRFIWEGRPFISLKDFSINVWAKIRSNGGDPNMAFSSTIIYERWPDVQLGMGEIGIEEHKSGRIFAGAGPWVVEGKDGRDYKVSFFERGLMLAEEEEAVLLVEWHVEVTV